MQLKMLVTNDNISGHKMLEEESGVSRDVLVKCRKAVLMQ